TGASGGFLVTGTYELTQHRFHFLKRAASRKKSIARAQIYCATLPHSPLPSDSSLTSPPAVTTWQGSDTHRWRSSGRRVPRRSLGTRIMMAEPKSGLGAASRRWRLVGHDRGIAGGAEQYLVG